MNTMPMTAERAIKATGWSVLIFGTYREQTSTSTNSKMDLTFSTRDAMS